MNDKNTRKKKQHELVVWRNDIKNNCNVFILIAYSFIIGFLLFFVSFSSIYFGFLFCAANRKVRFSLRTKKIRYETHFCFVCLSKIGIYSISANYRFTKVVLENANKKKLKIDMLFNVQHLFSCVFQLL